MEHKNRHDGFHCLLIYVSLLSFRNQTQAAKKFKEVAVIRLSSAASNNQQILRDTSLF